MTIYFTINVICWNLYLEFFLQLQTCINAYHKVDNVLSTSIFVFMSKQKYKHEEPRGYCIFYSYEISRLFPPQWYLNWFASAQEWANIFYGEPHWKLYSGFPHIFENHFNTKCKELSTITSLHFSKFLIMKLNSTHCINNEVLCLQYNSAQILEISFPFRNATLFQSLMYILAKYNTFSSLETQFWNSIPFQYFQYRVGTLFVVTEEYMLHLFTSVIIYVYNLVLLHVTWTL